MGFLQRNAFPLVGAGVLVVASVSFALTRGAQEDVLAEQEQQIVELDDRRAELVAEQEERGRLAADDVVGTNVHRLADDEALIEEVLGTALTWESHAEYEAARTTMTNVHGVPEDSAFMTEFLPSAPVNVESGGEEHALIDLLGLDSRVNSFQTDLISIQGTEYAYLVVVDVRTTSDDGEASALSTATVLLTTDGNGGVAELEGYATTSRVRSSGPD